jgi:hypothetical protein
MGTNFNYDDTSHQVIFDHINGGAGSGSLQESSESWQRLGDDVGVTCKSFAQSAIRGILAAREGAAAEAAVAAIGAMVPWMDDVKVIAASAAQRAQGQAEHWVTAKNSVPPVPPAPHSASFLGDPTEWMAQKMDWIPGLTTEEEKAQQRQQDAAEQARQAMRVYQSSSNGTVDPAPAFTTPQALDSNLGALPLTDPRVGTASATTPALAGSGAPAHLMTAHQPAAHQPVTHQPAAQPPAAYQPAATVSQLAGDGPTGTAGSGTPAPGRWAGNLTPNQNLTPLNTASGDGTAGRGRPRGAGASGRASRGAGAGHLTGFGPRPSTTFGPRPTASAHPSLGETSSARTSAGPAGATRGTGYEQPFAGGANQRGEQDREHRSKYLIHDDSNSIVGDLPPTAPPVIGADY